MVSCQEFLHKLVENDILKHQLKHRELGIKHRLDLPSVEQHYVGKIYVDLSFQITQVNFAIKSLNNEVVKFIGKPYSNLRNTTSYGIGFPLLSPKTYVWPEIIPISGDLFDGNVALIISHSEKKHYEIRIYGINKTEVPFNVNTGIKDNYSNAPWPFFNTLLESSSEGVFFLNDQRELQYVNSAGKEMIFQLVNHYPEPGSQFDHFIPLNYTQHYIEYTREALRGHTTKQEIALRTHQGKQLWYDFTLLPVYSAQEDIDYVMVKMQDKTRARIIERRYYDTKLRTSGTSQLKKAFLNGVSHDVRTPMNGIVGFADLLNKPMITDDKKQKYIDIIKTKSKSLLHVFEEILDVARLESDEMIANIIEFDLNSLFDDVYYYASNHFNNTNNKIKVHYSKGIDEPAIIKSDRGKIKQVLIHLLSCSIYQTEAGSIQFGYYFNRSGYLNIYVSDSGEGRMVTWDGVERKAESDKRVATLRALEYSSISMVSGYADFLGGSIKQFANKNYGSVYNALLPVDYHDGELQNNKKDNNRSDIPHVFITNSKLEPLKSLISYIAEWVKIEYYNRQIPTTNFENHTNIVFFHSGQSLQEVCSHIEALKDTNARFVFIADKLNYDTKMQLLEYGVHEYLSNDIYSPYFRAVMNKYLGI